jgi:hypothetical protein
MTIANYMQMFVLVAFIATLWIVTKLKASSDASLYALFLVIAIMSVGCQMAGVK